MKQRTSEQEEFKTIFNQLDEGILISHENRISKFNDVFQKLINRYFEKDTIQKVREISDARNLVELDKHILKNRSRINKCKYYLNYICGYREENRVEDLTNNDKILFHDAEGKIFDKKIFQRFITAKQKQNQVKKSADVATGHSLLDLNDFTTDTNYSLKDLLNFDKENLD